MNEPNELMELAQYVGVRRASTGTFEWIDKATLADTLKKSREITRLYFNLANQALKEWYLENPVIRYIPVAIKEVRPELATDVLPDSEPRPPRLPADESVVSDLSPEKSPPKARQVADDIGEKIISPIWAAGRVKSFDNLPDPPRILPADDPPIQRSAYKFPDKDELFSIAVKINREYFKNLKTGEDDD